MKVIAGLMITLACSGVLAAEPTRRVLTFEDRIAAQKAIEQVYWNHRLWPKENPAPKPALSAVLPDAQVRAKVKSYLAASMTRSSAQHRPITAAQLQVEVDRMTTHTRDPQLLHELFDALGNDPVVIAETLGRQTLTNRPLDSGVAEAGRASSPMAANASACSIEGWEPTSLQGAPTPRYRHTAVWTGAEMIVWGGSDNRFDLNSGGRYDPATDSWRPTSTGANVPAPRSYHTAVWTGTEMIVWGGGYPDVDTGGRYNPATDSWVPTSVGQDVPTARAAHTAVWTGTEMIVWGGRYPGVNTGGRYNPAADTWRPTSTGAHVPSPRAYHRAIWTGSEMLIWGDVNGAQDGGRYDPSTDTWRAIAIDANTPHLYDLPTVIWTGTEMIAWGGCEFSGDCPTNVGGRYNVATDSWLPVARGSNAPEGRDGHTAVWAGGEMIVWSGVTAGGHTSTGGRYNPATNKWVPTILGPNVPDGRDQHAVVWTGTEMIVWGGGSEGDEVLFGNGGRYCVPTACDDGNPCTADAIDAQGGCSHTPITCDDANSCTDDSCNPATGACSHTIQPDGASCDDGNPQTSDDSCLGGFCTSSNCSALPKPKNAGYYKKLCKDGHGHPHAHDALLDSDAACVGNLTSTFAGMTTVDDICAVIDTGHHHGPDGDGPDGKTCDQGEDELMALALNLCRDRVCADQEIDSSCAGGPHDHTLTSVAASLVTADAILSNASRDKDTCKNAKCLAKEINNGHGMHHTSLFLDSHAGNDVRLNWNSPVMDDGSGEASSYAIWRRPLNSEDAFVELGITQGVTFLDKTAGTGDWEYEVTFTIQP